MTKFIPEIKELPVEKRVQVEPTALQLANPPQIDAPLIARYKNNVLYGTFEAPVGPNYPSIASHIRIAVEGMSSILIDANEWDIELIDGEPLSESIVGTSALDGGDVDV